METKLFYSNEFFCPICGDFHQESEFLSSIITDEKTLWLANMITHYRHYHIASWNRCWGDNGYYYRKKWFSNYDYEKHKVNERAIRQIFRKCLDFIKANEITLDTLLNLQHNDPETIETVRKLLNKVSRKNRTISDNKSKAA